MVKVYTDDPHGGASIRPRTPRVLRLRAVEESVRQDALPRAAAAPEVLLAPRPRPEPALEAHQETLRFHGVLPALRSPGGEAPEAGLLREDGPLRARRPRAGQEPRRRLEGAGAPLPHLQLAASGGGELPHRGGGVPEGRSRPRVRLFRRVRRAAARQRRQRRSAASKSRQVPASTARSRKAGVHSS